jgi:hypothetical protein
MDHKGGFTCLQLLAMMRGFVYGERLGVEHDSIQVVMCMKQKQ